MFPIGIYVKPIKVYKKLQIKTIEPKYINEFKKLNPRTSRDKKNIKTSKNKTKNKTKKNIKL